MDGWVRNYDQDSVFWYGGDLWVCSVFKCWSPFLKVLIKWRVIWISLICTCLFQLYSKIEIKWKDENERRGSSSRWSKELRVWEGAALNLRYRVQPGPDRDSSPHWIDPLFEQNLHDSSHFIAEWAQAEAVDGGWSPPPSPRCCLMSSIPSCSGLPACVGRQPCGRRTFKNKQPPVPSG